MARRVYAVGRPEEGHPAEAEALEDLRRVAHFAADGALIFGDDHVDRSGLDRGRQDSRIPAGGGNCRLPRGRVSFLPENRLGVL